MKNYEEMIKEARRAKAAVYLATDAAVADDLSRIIGDLVDALEDATREGEYSVIATVGKDNPEARVGFYRTEFEANAVAKEWNRVNNKHGVKYHVEKDW